MLWGFFENRSTAADYVSLVPSLLPALYCSSVDAAGTVALACWAAAPAVAALDDYNTLVDTLVGCLSLTDYPMLSFFCAHALVHLAQADSSDERRLRYAIRRYVARACSQDGVTELKVVEAQSLYRWINLQWACDLLASSEDEFVLLGCLSFSHLLQNTFNLPLLSSGDMDTIVACQHHPAASIRAFWTAYLLPYFSTRGYMPPKLSTMLELWQKWHAASPRF